jgi:hypothetical protein
MRRLLMGVAALTTVALPISVAVVVAAPAANAGVSLTCAKIKGSETGSVTVLKCSVSKADKKTYKEATAAHASALITGSSVRPRCPRRRRGRARPRTPQRGRPVVSRVDPPL